MRLEGSMKMYPCTFRAWKRRAGKKSQQDTLSTRFRLRRTYPPRMACSKPTKRLVQFFRKGT